MQIKETIYDWGGYNTKLFYIINGIQGEAYQKIMLFGTQFGYYKLFPIYFAALLIIAYFCTVRKKELRKDIFRDYRNKWLKCLATLAIAYGCSLIWITQFKHIFQFPRPFASLPGGSVNILERVMQDSSPMTSFPSGHSSFAMLMAAGLWPVLNLPGKIAACCYVLLVGLSRIAIGVHFPADVVLSFIMSFLVVYLVSKIVNCLARRIC